MMMKFIQWLLALLFGNKPPTPQPSPEPEPMARFSILGDDSPNNYNSTIIAAAAKAAAFLPPGYRVQAYSGHRASTPGSPQGFHATNQAVDFRIYDPHGKMLPNYQDPEQFRIYEAFAQDCHAVMLEDDPKAAAAHRFGGYFSGKLGVTYGACDIMHQDLGGDRIGMAAGSWRSGLVAAYQGVFDTKACPSCGMGADYEMGTGYAEAVKVANETPPIPRSKTWSQPQTHDEGWEA